MSNTIIEEYVTRLLDVSGINNEPLALQQTLHHMLMCVKLYETLDAEQRERVAKWRKHFQFLIEIKFNLKETRRKKERKSFPSNTPIQEKEKKDKKEKMCVCVCDAKSAFRSECLSFVGKYDTDLLANFYNYWSEENPSNGKMRFQSKRYWNTKKRLDLWVKNQYSTDSVAASERLKKARGQQQKEGDEERRSKELAAEREEANTRLEEQIEQSKAGAVTREEWEAMKAAREQGGSSDEGNDADKIG